MRLALLATTLLALAAAPALAETKTYTITGFKKLEVDSAYTVEFTQGPFSVVADSRENNLDKIIVEKRGDTLHVTRPKNTNIRHRVEDIIRISAPSLDEIRLHSAIEFTADRLNADTLKIVTHSATKVKVASLDAKTLDIDAHSAAVFEIKGNCGKLSLKLDSASKFEGGDLRCREAAIEAGTASTVRAWASEKARAEAGVASNVTIGGKPKDFDGKTAKFAGNIIVTD